MDTGVDCAVSGSFLRLTADGKIPPNATTPVFYTHDWAYAPIGPERERQLFDLKTDPYAETNIAADHSDVVKELHERFTKWLEDLESPAETMELLGEEALG